jgi:hypothetical protein
LLRLHRCRSMHLFRGRTTFRLYVGVYFCSM